MRYLILLTAGILASVALMARAQAPAPTVLYSQNQLPDAVKGTKGALIAVQYMSDGTVTWRKVK